MWIEQSILGWNKRYRKGRPGPPAAGSAAQSARLWLVEKNLGVVVLTNMAESMLPIELPDMRGEELQPRGQSPLEVLPSEDSDYGMLAIYKNIGNPDTTAISNSIAGPGSSRIAPVSGARSKAATKRSLRRGCTE